MEFYIPRIGNDKVKDRIIENLIVEPGLTLREICFRISKTNSVTYQAVYKALGELAEKEILSKEEKCYKINHLWTEKLQNFTIQIEQNYREVFEKINRLGIVTMDFNSQLNFGKFLLSFISNFRDSLVKKIMIINGWHIYNMLWLSENEMGKFESWRDLDVYFLSDSDCEVDRWLAKVWENIGAKVDYGAQNCKSSDYIVIGDLIIEIHWNKQIKIDWEKQRGSMKIKDYDILKGVQHISDREKPMKVLIFRDAEFASEIRERTLARF